MLGSFTCPRCRALLKVRDESFVGKVIPCPECHVQLVVSQSDAGDLFGAVASTDTSDPKKRSPRETGTGRNGPKSVEPASRAEATTDSLTGLNPTYPVSRVPQFVAWIVAGVCLLILIPFLIPRGDTSSPTGLVQKKAPSTNNPTAPVPPDNDSVPDTSQNGKPGVPAETTEQKLFTLGQWLTREQQERGHFPAGTVSAGDLTAAQRLSWQARFADKYENSNSLPISWEHAWNDPVNERFVRRAVTALQNPGAENKISEDRYPASHFVGIAGVGADAPTLPVDHPRAGIFGETRQTKVSEITDGLSNTMMVAGIEKELGSWARGTASYRALTREPYLHGPDGFGTGPGNSMFVLMADGSVREVSDKTDPRILRRMAAMADGLPLDATVPGEPGDKPVAPTQPIKPEVTSVEHKNSKPATVTDANTKPTDKPAENKSIPLIVKPEKVIDIPAALRRQVLKFEQKIPAPAFELLLQIEDLAGVRIEYDRKKLGPAAARLDKPITLQKENATLDELLAEILKQISLKREDGKQTIQIVE